MTITPTNDNRDKVARDLSLPSAPVARSTVQKGHRAVHFNSAVLLEHSLGVRERRDADHAAYARAQVVPSWQQGRLTAG